MSCQQGGHSTSAGGQKPPYHHTTLHPALVGNTARCIPLTIAIHCIHCRLLSEPSVAIPFLGDSIASHTLLRSVGTRGAKSPFSNVPCSQRRHQTPASWCCLRAFGP
eukprot:GGOE01024156.1.p2 GENE.GGOE01024156.1~~GGOE01024156.1.p2  ORF type:complete len:107 (-),score=1.80 GGOE01024156.1:172-492(-)